MARARPRPATLPNALLALPLGVVELLALAALMALFEAAVPVDWEAAVVLLIVAIDDDEAGGTEAELAESDASEIGAREVTELELSGAAPESELALLSGLPADAELEAEGVALPPEPAFAPPVPPL